MFRITQKEISSRFGFSVSTVFQALKVPRKMGAVRVGGRYFIVEDSEKLLYLWASVRNLEVDVLFRGFVDKPVYEIEGIVSPDVIFGGYTAARMKLKTTPSDYDKVILYADKMDEIHKRYEFKKGRDNVLILKKDNFMSRYGEITTLAQTFVDLWNMDDWYAKEYTNAIKEKIIGKMGSYY